MVDAVVVADAAAAAANIVVVVDSVAGFQVHFSLRQDVSVARVVDLHHGGEICNDGRGSELSSCDAMPVILSSKDDRYNLVFASNGS